MNIFKAVGKFIGKRLLGFVYNEDRAVDSLVTAKPQETLSSEIGRHEKDPVDKVAAKALNAIQSDHVEHAVQHANALDKADNGFEG